MGVTRSIAWRFLLKGTEKGTFSAMTLFAWLAIGVGVGAMSSLLSVMYGFEGSLKEKVLKAYPHVIVKPRAGSGVIKDYAPWTEKFRAVKHAKSVIPYLETEMIVQSEHRTLGGVVWGVPAAELKTHYAEGIVQGGLPDPKAKLPELVLGIGEGAHASEPTAGLLFGRPATKIQQCCITLA